MGSAPAATLLCGACGRTHAENQVFYVTARSGRQASFLLGPYESHVEAMANVERGRDLAIGVDVWAWFYDFGTAATAREYPTKFGK